MQIYKIPICMQNKPNGDRMKYLEIKQKEIQMNNK